MFRIISEFFCRFSTTYLAVSENKFHLFQSLLDSSIAFSSSDNIIWLSSPLFALVVQWLSPAGSTPAADSMEDPPFPGAARTPPDRLAVSGLRVARLNMHTVEGILR